MNTDHVHAWTHTNDGILGTSMWTCGCGAKHDGAKIMGAQDYDEALVAAYERPGSDSDARRKAMFAASGNPALEARVEAVDLARENAVIRTIMHAQRIGAGWTGNEVDVAHLHRALRRTGVVP